MLDSQGTNDYALHVLNIPAGAPTTALSCAEFAVYIHCVCARDATPPPHAHFNTQRVDLAFYGKFQGTIIKVWAKPNLDSFLR
jgi:hypothetical protein